MTATPIPAFAPGQRPSESGNGGVGVVEAEGTGVVVEGAIGGGVEL